MIINNTLKDIFIEQYTVFSKYTIKHRAIPSLEDGCKDIHRRIIWGNYVNGQTYDRNRIKCNTAVGNIMKYSPHGNASIYKAIVRFANDTVNHKIIDGKGAFGHVYFRDIEAGSDRYVEVRLSKIANEFLKNVKSKNIMFVD